MSSETFSDELQWRSLSSSDRQREYSPSSCLDGDLQPFIQEYVDASDAARGWCEREGLDIQTISYGASVTETIDALSS